MPYILEFRSIENNAKRIVKDGDSFEWIPVKSLVNNTFAIKPYQRGYRWEENNVIKLLEDIDKYSFAIGNNFPQLFTSMSNNKLDLVEKFDFFCLQTLTVSKVEDNTYELIDGQQRLTSIFLICEMLGIFLDGAEDRDDAPYVIKYERTSKESKEITKEIHDNLPTKVEGVSAKKALSSFINNTISDPEWFEKYKELISDSIGKLRIDENNAYLVDLYYIEYALLAIVDYIKDHAGKTDFNQMQKCIKQNLFFIWYEVENDPYIAFSSINSNQIKLTNSELIKSLLLRTGSNCENAALRWETIEQGLCNDDLWAFISNEDKATHMDFVLELYARYKGYESGLEEYSLFDWYEQNCTSSENAIESIETIYERILEWYDDVDIYHLIGLLTKIRELNLGEWDSQESLVKKLFDEYNDSNDKKEFIISLKQKVKDSLLKSVNIDKNSDEITVNDLLYNLTYDNSDDQHIIEAVLWTVNVWECIEAAENNKYKKTGKSINLVSRAPKINTRFPFALASGSKAKWTLEHIMPQNPQNASNDEKQKYEQLIKEIKDNNKQNLVLQGTEIHNIKNLVLLKSDDNSSLSNNNLAKKREKIVERLGKGSFVPSSTINAFLLYYTSMENIDTSGVNSQYWTKVDAEAYNNRIVECLSKFGVPKDGEINDKCC